MSGELSGTVLRRQIGRRFTKLRQRKGLTMEQAAKLMDVGRTTLTRIEDGEGVRFKELYVRHWLGVLDATPEETQLLLEMTAETRDGTNRGWWHSYGGRALPKWFTLFVSLQDAADQILEYENELVPGLLQTAEYAREIFRIAAGDRGEEEIEQQAEARIKRQGLLSRPHPPRLDVILNESVLCRPVGGAAVMARQLAAVLEASRRPNVSVRILPYSAGAHVAMASAFTLLDFPRGADGALVEPPLAYIDTFTGSMHINEPEEVAVYRTAWADLSAKALDASASRETITKAMEEISG